MNDSYIPDKTRNPQRFGVLDRFKVIRIDPSREITDRVTDITWTQAIDAFAEGLKRERYGCTWMIIDPQGQIAARADF